MKAKTEKNKKGYLVLMIFSGILFVVSLIMFLHTNNQYKESQVDSDEAQSIAGIEQVIDASEDTEDAGDTEDTAKARVDSINEAADDASEESEVQDGTRRLQSLQGSTQAQALAQLDLDALKEVNSDVIGWICIPGTLVNYPLMKGEDNQFYLEHTWKGKSNAAGSIFLECECSPDFSDFNTIIYGHRMSNTSMFGALASYKKQEFWSEHRHIYICLDGVIRKYTIFAAYEPKVTDCTYWIHYSQDAHKQEVIDFALEQTVIDCGILPVVSDSIITLSTCTGNGHATRWVVQAVLVGEMKTAEDTDGLQPEGN